MVIIIAFTSTLFVLLPLVPLYILSCYNLAVENGYNIEVFEGLVYRLNDPDFSRSLHLNVIYSILFFRNIYNQANLHYTCKR